MINIIRTGLDASNKEISAISHNLANGSTIGFKEVPQLLQICIQNKSN